MARTVPLQDRFDRMVRDVPRNAMPKGACWTLQDSIPNLGAPARTRGGYINFSNNVNLTTGSSNSIVGGIYADQLVSGQNLVPKMLVVDQAGELLDIDTSVPQNNNVTTLGFAFASLQNPVQIGGKVIFPHSSGSLSPRKYSATAGIGVLNSAPAGRYATVWKALLLLASNRDEPQRVWFSTADYDPEQWDVVNTYWDMSSPIVGLSAMRNAVLIFHENYVSRLRGSTPPPGGDLIADDPLFNVGCVDARSIATWGEQVVWANKDGLYISDGIVPNDLTQLCGMKTYWRDLMAGFHAAITVSSGPGAENSGYTIAGGVIQNHYVFAIMNDNLFVDAAMIDLQRYNWVQLTNIDAACFFHTTSVTGAEKLFMGRRQAPYVGELSTMFSPAALYKADGDGAAVQMVLETPFFELGAGIDSFKTLYATYDLRDANGDDPELQVSYVKTPEETIYTPITQALAETVGRSRQRLPLRYSGQGLGLKIQQQNATSDGRLWALEVDGHARESSRLT